MDWSAIPQPRFSHSIFDFWFDQVSLHTPPQFVPTQTLTFPQHPLVRSTLMLPVVATRKQRNNKVVVCGLTSADYFTSIPGSNLTPVYGIFNVSAKLDQCIYQSGPHGNQRHNGYVKLKLRSHFISSFQHIPSHYLSMSQWQ